MPDHFHVISGASGGGTSTLIEALAARGWRVVREPGRRIVQEELGCGGSAGSALPRHDPTAFMERLFARCVADFDAAAAADDGRPVFFGRALPEVLGCARRLGPGPEPRFTAAAARCRCAPRVWIAPPWREIFVTDAERRASFAAAVADQAVGDSGYREAGYTVHALPVAARTDWPLAALGLPPH